MAFGSSVMRQMFNGSQPSEPALPAPQGACLGPSSPASLMFPDILGAPKALRCFAEEGGNTK